VTLTLTLLVGIPYLVRKEEKDPNFQLQLHDITLRFFPQTPVLLAQRCSAYAKLGKSEQAITDCNQAVSLAPKDAGVYNQRGMVYGRLGKYEQAIADCTKAIRLKPDYAYAYGNRGYVYEYLGNLVAARSDWEQAIKLFEAQERWNEVRQLRGELSRLKP
jgi:Flp pilus assembly protein TadD